MIDLKSHKGECELFLRKLDTFQKQLLLLNKVKAEKELSGLYNSFKLYIENILTGMISKDKHSEEFLIKKQLHLVLRNLESFLEINKKLPGMSSEEILKYFEKQYKLKQILRKQIRDIS